MVERYKVVEVDNWGEGGFLEVDTDGDWVRYSDFAPLQSENDRLTRMLQTSADEFAALRDASTAEIGRLTKERGAAISNAEIVCNNYADENQRLYDRAIRAEASAAVIEKLMKRLEIEHGAWDPHGYRLIPKQPSGTMLEIMAFNLSDEFGADFTRENEAFAMAVYDQIWRWASIPMPSAPAIEPTVEQAPAGNDDTQAGLSSAAPQEAEAVEAWIEREALAELRKHKNADAVVCSGLLKSPFGDKVPLYAHAPAQEVTEAQKAKQEAIDMLIQADDVWTDYGSGFRVHFSFHANSGLMGVVERINTARALTAAQEAGR